MSDAGHNATDKMLEGLEKRISREYSASVKEMTKKVNAYLKQFKEEDKKKKALVKQGLLSKSDYDKWRLAKMATGKRWTDMRDTLSQDLANTTLIARKMIGEHIKDVYALNANYGTYEIEKAIRIDTSFALYDHATVERLLKDNPQILPQPGKKTAQLIAEGKAKRWSNKTLQSVMIQSILQGDSIPHIAQRLTHSVGEMEKHAAIRNARTMTTAAESAGRIDSYKRAEGMGVKMKQMWLATLDGRTRHEHRILDRQTVPVGKPFEVDGYKIMHPGDLSAPGYLIYNCRCRVIGDVEGTELDSELGGMRENADIEGMSYEEWRDAKLNKKIVKKDDDFVISDAQLEKEREFNRKIDAKIADLNKEYSDSYIREIEIDGKIMEVEKEGKILGKDYSMFDSFSTKEEYFEYRDNLEGRYRSLQDEYDTMRRTRPRSENFTTEAEYDTAFEKYLEQRRQIRSELELAQNEYYRLVNNYPGNWSYIEAQRAAKASSGIESIDERIAKLRQEQEELIKRRGEIIEELQTARSQVVYNSARLVDEAEGKGVFYDRPAPYSVKPSTDSIVDRVAGGDLTEGSCASLGFCYIGQKDGYDVLDFRDGASRELFSTRCGQLVSGISRETGKPLFTAETKTGTGGAIRLTKQMEPGKEYYLVTGKHAAIMRKRDNQIEYLELQSSRENGWRFMGMDGDRKQLDEMFRWRFGCSSSISGHAYMMDVDDMKDSKLLHRMYGYMNTNEAKQHKGAAGHER